MKRAAIAIALLAATLGLCTQARWNAQCDAVLTGATWNPDNWSCSK